MGRAKNSDVQVPQQEITEQETSELTLENSDREDEACQRQFEDVGFRRIGEKLQNRTGADKAKLSENVLQPYAVAFNGVLRLRQEPNLDAPIIAELPCGAGVFADGEPGPAEWLHVRTGRLSGWMMAKHLEVLPMPDLGNETD